ncbi:MAG: molybdenum cofactor guanylyltransferase [Methanobrevibacter sp.]|nr:molybdenum cofactor guanylyltransferase [Methanobrevibacter sp.]
MKNGNLRSAIVLCGGMSRRMGEDKGSMIINKKPMILHVLEALNNQIDEAILVLNNSERIAKYKKIIHENYFSQDLNNVFSYDLIFLEDEIKDQGPLSGIMTGLENISSNYALILPCDSPFVNDNFISFMFDSLDTRLAIDTNNNSSKNSHLDDLNFIDAFVPYHYKNKESNDFFSFKHKNYNYSHDNHDENVNNNYNNFFNNNYFLNNENERLKNFLLKNSEPLHSIYRKNNSKKIRKLLNSNVHDVKSLLQSINSYFLLMNSDNTFKNINTKEDF